MTVGKKVAIAVISVLIILIAVGGTLFFLLMQDDSKGRYQEEANTDLIVKAIAAAGTGKEAEITQKELNGFLAYLFEQRQEQRNIQVNSLYFTLGEEQGTAGVYAPFRFYGLEIGITARVNLSFDQEAGTIAIRIDEMKAGRLPVPQGWALSMIKQSLPEGVSIHDNQVLLDTKKIDWHLGELGELLEIRDVRVEKGNLYLSTNGMVDALEGYLMQQMGNTQWGDLINSLGDTVKDYLSGWLQ